MEFFHDNDGTVLHIICRRSDFMNMQGRRAVSAPTEFLQLAMVSPPNGKSFNAHRHLPLERQTNVTQESWVVISGRVLVTLYDMMNKMIVQLVLEAGDCLLTLYGGHAYEILADNTYVYEFKTGPYLGREKDKAWL